MSDSFYIKNLIAGGEGLHLDFKYNISSASKIAKSLVAFANTDGGALLIGVKDNGNITGVKSEEEIYMIELASQKYCNPIINPKITDFKIDNHIVLEVEINSSSEKPHFAKDDNGVWDSYIRVQDKNIKINAIYTEVIRRRNSGERVSVQIGDTERKLMDLLDSKKRITQKEFQDALKIKDKVAEKILINLLSIGMIKIDFTPNEYYYSRVE